MWKAIVAALLLAGCVPLPPSPQDIEAKQFRPVPDKAVIYLVRDRPDFSNEPASIWLGETATITTYAGTYYRWETAPGQHTISGFGPDGGSFQLATQAGGVYFVLQRYLPAFFAHPQSRFQLMNADDGRAAVLRSELIGGR